MHDPLVEIRGLGRDKDGRTSQRPEAHFSTPVQHVLPLTGITSGKEIPRTVLRHSHYKNARGKSKPIGIHPVELRASPHPTLI